MGRCVHTGCQQRVRAGLDLCEQHYDSDEASLLHVYYGQERRWDFDRLALVQELIGVTASHFDGLESVFELRSSEAAMAALLVLRSHQIAAEWQGVGQGPSPSSLRRARWVMGESYRRLLRLQRDT